MDYKAKYLKYKAKYEQAKQELAALEAQRFQQLKSQQLKSQQLKSQQLKSQQLKSQQFGGDDTNSTEVISHVSKNELDMSKIQEIMKNTPVSNPETAIEMPSSEDVSKNEDIEKMKKKNRNMSRSQSRSMPFLDVYIIQPNYMDNPSKALAKFKEGAQFYGRSSFFGQIYSHYVNYGMNFINNTVMFSGLNSNILQEDLINGVFTFQMSNGALYQVRANYIGVTGFSGNTMAIIWAWVQTLFTTASYANVLDRIVRDISRSPELQQASGLNPHSGTSITYTPGLMDPQEWYYMMIVGYLSRAQGYFSLSTGPNNHSYYLIMSIRQA